MYGASEGLGLGLYHLNNIMEPKTLAGLMNNNGQYLDRDGADHIWKLLKGAIQQIQRKHNCNLTFEELYRYGYILVMQKYGCMLHSGLQNIIADHLTSQVQPQVLANLNRNFLPVINDTWAHHQTSLTIIKDILMYMDRVYVLQQSIDNVYTMGTNLFKNLVVQYDRIQLFLQNTLLDLVRRERNGELMDRPEFRTATKMLMALGNSSSSVYKENFETAFLQQSANFYKLESQQLLEENDASLYLRRVESRLHEEIERAEHCYDSITIPKVIKVVEDELIQAHMTDVVEMSNSGVVHMMQHQMTDDLACMYRLLSRVSEGLTTMFNCISRYVREEGKVLVQDETSNNNALIYVQSLLDLKEKIDFYLINSFSNNKLCKKIIATDFEHILNFNSKSPEYLSLFIDEKLKKGVRGMTDDDKLLLLEKTIVLFRFIQDKDLFEQYYKQHLAKRLLVNKTINEDNEKCVIVKFKGECGLQYTCKLEGMFRDIWASTSITEVFNKHIADSGEPMHGVDISLRVLTAVYWPTYTVPSPINLPKAPLTAYKTFEKFYMSQHCGRQLTLLPQLGSAELEACFSISPHHENNHFYTLQVSTYQMCVLMLFNYRSQWTFQELQDMTNISHRDLHRALQSLITGKQTQKILTKQPDCRKIELGDTFYVNTAFSSKTNRVKIPPFQVKYETESERQDTMKRVKEDRNHEVEAAIIRVIKAQRLINYENLMTEVYSMLSPRFLPSRDIFKTRIEVLIERGYITRNAEDRRMFEYVP